MINHCILEGRLAAPAEERTLPSGDTIVTFRIIVPREEPGRVDTIDCCLHAPRLRRRMLAIPALTDIHVEGQLHRRFWRGPTGPVSRHEVVVSLLRRCT